MIDKEANKRLFVSVYSKYIKRDGAKELLAWLERSDFFDAPASTKYHLNVPGGLCEHSLNVFYRLRGFLGNEYNPEHGAECPYDDESIAIVSLLHDICKANFYGISWKRQKTYDEEKVSAQPRYLVKHDEDGDYFWERVPFYEIDEQFIYGHGEKSVYIVNEFMKLTPEEAQAIRFHMGAYVESDSKNCSAVYAQNTLAFYLHVADEAATFIDET